ncbi:MAG: ABC transporter permease [bacterium]|nr:ABC transporter permease [bacterium]
MTLLRGLAGLLYSYAIHIAKDPLPVLFYFVVPVAAVFSLGGLYVSTGADISEGRFSASMAMAVTFGMLLMSNVAYALHRDAILGIDRRYCGPMSWRVYRLGRLIGPTLLVALHVLVIALLGALLDPVDLNISIGWLLVLAIWWGAFIAICGLVVYQLSRTFAQFTALSSLLAMLLALFGGVIVPPDRLPRAVESVSAYMPIRWFRELFTESILSGGPSPEYRSIATMCIYTIVLAVLAFRGKPPKTSRLEAIG